MLFTRWLPMPEPSSGAALRFAPSSHQKAHKPPPANAGRTMCKTWSSQIGPIWKQKAWKKKDTKETSSLSTPFSPSSYGISAEEGEEDLGHDSQGLKTRCRPARSALRTIRRLRRPLISERMKAFGAERERNPFRRPPSAASLGFERVVDPSIPQW